MATIPYTTLTNPKTKKGDQFPFAKVQLNCKKTHKVFPVPINALIDSGAGVCFCKETIGVWLGINFRKIKKEEFYSANKTSFHAKPALVNMIAYGKKYECKIYFTDEIPNHTPIILGQLGFFDHFKITFDRANSEITLS